MVKPISEDEVNALFQAVADRRWEEAELLRQAIEIIVQQRLYIEGMQEVVAMLRPTIDMQQAALLKHGII